MDAGAVSDPKSLGAVVQIDEGKIRAHLDEVVRATVEETLNALQDAEADVLCGARKYERTEDRKDTRAGSYERQLHTKAGEVTLQVPKLRSLPFERQPRGIERSLCDRRGFATNKWSCRIPARPTGWRSTHGPVHGECCEVARGWVCLEEMLIRTTAHTVGKGIFFLRHGLRSQLRFDGLALLLLPGLVAGACLIAQTSGQTAPIVSVDPAGLVRRAVEHRLEAGRDHHPVRYVLHKKDERHDTTKEIVETRDGDVARLVAVDGRPLSPEADKAELVRLEELAKHPELQEHRHRSEQKDAARVDHLMALLPDALLYKIEGIEACGTAQCYRLSYKPNPRFNPPDMEASVLRGVTGEVWIDTVQERLTRLVANFTADVDFGFGILGKLNKGGKVELEQTDVGAGGVHDWELTGLKMNVTGKALMVRSLSVGVIEEASHFEPVPEMSYRDAIQMLK